LKKIFEDSLVAAEIADGGGGGALVFVDGDGFDGRGWGVSQTGFDDAVVLEDDGAFRAGDFNAAGIAGIGGGGSVEDAENAAREFEDGCGGVFGFDFVKHVGGASLHANDITEKPKKQIDGVDALIDQGAAAVESERAPPARTSIILGRAIPLDAGVDEEGLAEEVLIEPILELANVRLHAVLKNHAELDVGLLGGFDEGVGTGGANFDRFFSEDVQALTGGGNALHGVEAGRAAEDDEIHRAMT